MAQEHQTKTCPRWPTQSALILGTIYSVPIFYAATCVIGYIKVVIASFRSFGTGLGDG